MSGIKNFVLGFGISLAGMSFIGHLLNSTTISNSSTPVNQKIQIELFKSAEAKTTLIGFETNNHVNKKVISSSEYNIASLPSSPTNLQNGIEDDEILTINIDNIIPIEFENTSGDETESQILNTDKDNSLVAMLPSDTPTINEESSPWVITKGSKFIDNKNFIEAENLEKDLLSSKFTQAKDDGEFISYKVAEKI